MNKEMKELQEQLETKMRATEILAEGMKEYHDRWKRAEDRVKDLEEKLKCAEKEQARMNTAREIFQKMFELVFAAEQTDLITVTSSDIKSIAKCYGVEIDDE